MRLVLSLAVALTALLASACGSGGSTAFVGYVDAGNQFVSTPGSDAGGASGLDAYIEEGDVAVTFVTVSCAGGCAVVQAVPTGGYPPYTFAWDNGSTSATRTVCPSPGTDYAVKVTDTASSGEFPRPAQTVQVPLGAKVGACPDAGPLDAGAGADAAAPTVYWATWSQVTTGAQGSAEGSLSPPQGNVQVDFAGEVDGESSATGGVTLSGWGPVNFAPSSTFESATVGNGPPPTGMIALSGTQTATQTITFSEPVDDPLIAVLSGSALQFDFDATPTLLSSGGFILGNSMMFAGGIAVSGQTLTPSVAAGSGGAGVIEFVGTFTSLTFTMPTPESQCCFTVFTVGIRGA